jgi:hypothetical protein
VKAPVATFVRRLMFVGVPLPISNNFQACRVDGQVNRFVVMPSTPRDLDQGTPAGEVVWSGVVRFKSITRTNDATKPSVCRSGKRNRARQVKAVTMARSE